MKRLFYLLCIMCLGASYSSNAQIESTSYYSTQNILKRAQESVRLMDENESKTPVYGNSYGNYGGYNSVYNYDMPVYRSNEAIPVGYVRPIIMNRGKAKPIIIGVEITPISDYPTYETVP